MSTKKKNTNLGKLAHVCNSWDEFVQGIGDDADSFLPEVNEILLQFNKRNPYDVTVLELVVAMFFANATVLVEGEFPEFEECVKRNYNILIADFRDKLKEAADAENK